MRLAVAEAPRTDELAQMLVLRIGYSAQSKQKTLLLFARSGTAVKRRLSLDAPLQHSETRGSLEECLEPEERAPSPQTEEAKAPAKALLGELAGSLSIQQMTGLG